MAFELLKCKVQEVPPTVYYVPNFINEVEESWILDKVNNAPKPKWTQLLNRRLQNWGGIPLPSGMIIESLPDWLKNFVDKVSDLNIFEDGKLRANHVLVNEYLPGQGIMPHVDGPLFYPTIATINCGAHTVLEFEKNSTLDEENNLEKQLCLLLERRSLIIVQDKMYTDYKHCIRERTIDKMDKSIKNLKMTQFSSEDTLTRSTRISLTIRHVPKTSKIQLRNLIR